MMNEFDIAAEVLQTQGFCKFISEDKHGHVCVYGALTYKNAVMYNHDKYIQMSEVLDRVACKLFPERAVPFGDGTSSTGNRLGRGAQKYSAAHINNHPDTTMEDMLLVLKHASYE